MLVIIKSNKIYSDDTFLLVWIVKINRTKKPILDPGTLNQAKRNGN